MKLLRVAVSFIVLVFACQCAFAQNTASNIESTLLSKFQYYAAKKQQGALFAHFDKTIYTSNENIWFTAYAITDTSSRNDILSAIMVNEDSQAIALKDRFKMAKGIASGRMFLPDTVPPGNYSFILYTNSLTGREPRNVFVQQVTVKSTAPASFVGTMTLQDTAKVSPTGSKVIILSVMAPGSQAVAGAKVSYYLGDKARPALSGTVKTDNAGQYLLNIPVSSIAPGSNVLHAQISYNSDVKYVDLELPVRSNPLIVKFYPEGGSLSDGLASKIGLEIKNAEGAPYALKGVLYKDDKAVDTLSTNPYGMGSFTLVPYKANSYTVKFKLAGSPDSVFHLPAILAGSPVVTMANAIAGNTLNVTVKSKLGGKFYVLVHNYQQSYLSIPVQASADGKNVVIDLSTVPKGIAEITLLDSLQQPYAERLFFAHYDQHNQLQVNTESDTYKPRQKVNVKLNLTGPDGKPLTGKVSIAAVQANRIDPKKTQDIESYFYLNNDLGILPQKQNYLGGSAADKAFLEDVLLIKGWRRYTWPELMEATAADTTHLDDGLVFKGNITDLGKKMKESVTFMLTRDSSRKAFASVPNGDFSLADSDLYVNEYEKVHLYVTGNEKVEYFFNVNDPYVGMNKKMAMQYRPEAYRPLVLSEQRASQESLKGFEHAIQLKEVNIRGGVDTLMNACGDFICINGILNCPNHHHDPQNKIPLKGHTYYIFNPLTTIKKPFVYKGCNPDIDDAAKGFDGVHYAMEFYGADYEKSNPATPDYLSTIYWNKLYHVTPGQPATVSFFASDVTGSFKIIVQGVTNKGVVYGEKTVTVEK